jgi:hypothetical protein
MDLREYFSKDVPNTYEWVQMKRIAIKKLLATGLGLVEISEIINLSHKNTWRASRMFVDKHLVNDFNNRVINKQYPKRKGNRTIWEN